LLVLGAGAGELALVLAVGIDQVELRGALPGRQVAAGDRVHDGLAVGEMRASATFFTR
jgi:hypothetical protein